MTSFAERTRTLAIRIVAGWQAAVTRLPPVPLIVIGVLLLTLPLVFFRGYNADEGLAVAIARAAIEDGQWLTPHMFNARWVERPALLSWLIAGLSLPFGAVDQIIVRVTLVLFLLGGCLLIYHLLRRAGATTAAAILAAAAFLACPLVLRTSVMATADMPLAVLLFAAFVLWWLGHQDGRLTLPRWIAIGIVLAFAGLLKGPQPIAYFALGVGVFVLLTRSWRQIPGLVLAGAICVTPMAAWYASIIGPGDHAHLLHFMRIAPNVALPPPWRTAPNVAIGILPVTLLVAAFLFKGRDGVSQQERRLELIKALVCYAAVASLIILFWPRGSAPRYFYPAILPLCVLGGFAYDALCERRPQLIAPGIVVTVALLCYGLVYAALSPFLPQQYRGAWIDAERISNEISGTPATIYKTGDLGLNVFPYVAGRIVITDLPTLEKLSGPAWIAVQTEDAERLKTRRPGVLRPVLSFGRDGEWQLLRLDG